ncbi:hypothetical protein BD779DRAFT_1710166 [Infundibulicybe gibba]|nr:hypothetical protein BD779DRAFT_1710166 [Infundibulicybe gibba]
MPQRNATRPTARVQDGSVWSNGGDACFCSLEQGVTAVRSTTAIHRAACPSSHFGRLLSWVLPASIQRPFDRLRLGARFSTFFPRRRRGWSWVFNILCVGDIQIGMSACGDNGHGDYRMCPGLLQHPHVVQAVVRCGCGLSASVPARREFFRHDWAGGTATRVGVKNWPCTELRIDILG